MGCVVMGHYVRLPSERGPSEKVAFGLRSIGEPAVSQETFTGKSKNKKL